MKLPRWSQDRFDIEPDRQLLARLTDEMETRGGAMKPANWWRLPEEYLQGTMETMLDPWCGAVGRIPLSEPDLIARTSQHKEILPESIEYLRAIDHAGLFTGVEVADLGRAGWRLFDLFSAMDALLITAFMPTGKSRRRILEVGGGFGRLPDFLARATGERFRYVNVEAVPMSLMFSYLYLKKHNPRRNVVLYESGMGADVDADVLIVPSWHAEEALAGQEETFDLCVNIESFQEMSQELVDYYIGLFDRMSRVGGHIYTVNAREFKFRGEWNYPSQWESLFRHRTRRSWTADHPAEIHRKRPFDATPRNTLREFFYRREVEAHRAGKA